MKISLCFNELFKKSQMKTDLYCFFLRKLLDTGISQKIYLQVMKKPHNRRKKLRK